MDTRLEKNINAYRLKRIIQIWKVHRRLTYSLLEFLPEEKLNETVSQNMGIIGRQFRHIGDVQASYINAIKTGQMIFGKNIRNQSIESSKQKLKSFLEEKDKEMQQLIKKNPDSIIKWGSRKVPLAEHLQYMVQHEILHHGQLIVYLRILGLDFPEAWSAIWGPTLKRR